MKKLLVVSDNHLQKQRLANILANYDDIDYFIHCGDSQWETDEPLLKNFIVVRGNNDFVAFSEDEVLSIEARKVLIVHGHWQNVFNYGTNPNIEGTEELVSYAKDMYGADVVFYGHTHIPETHIDRGVFVLNSGSINFPRASSPHIPTYAIVTIDNMDIAARFYDASTNVDVTQEVLKG